MCILPVLYVYYLYCIVCILPVLYSPVSVRNKLARKVVVRKPSKSVAARPSDEVKVQC